MKKILAHYIVSKELFLYHGDFKVTPLITTHQLQDIQTKIYYMLSDCIPPLGTYRIFPCIK